MDRFRDKALLLQFAGSLLGVLVAFQLGVNDEQAGLWLAAINGVISAISAVFVRPLSPTIISGAFMALAALVGGYGFELTPEKLSAINLALVMAVTFFFIRPNSTPASDPQPGQGITPVEAARFDGSGTTTVRATGARL